MNSGYIIAFLIVILGTAVAIYATRKLLNANKKRSSGGGGGGGGGGRRRRKRR